MRTLLLASVLVLAACATPAATPAAPAPAAADAPKPAAGAASAAPEEEFRIKPPPAGPAVTFTAPIPKVFKLKSGLAVWLIERPDLPLVSMQLVVDSGSNTNPGGLPGVSSFVAAMLDEGTAGRNALATATAFDDLAAIFRADSDSETFTATLSVPSASLAAALAIYADTVLHPAFRSADVERVRKLRLGDLQQMYDDASQVGRNVLARMIYGDNHPWGSPARGTLDGTRRMTRSALVTWHRTWVRPNNATLVVVGDVRQADLVPLLEAGFGSWTAGKVPAIKLPPPAIQKAQTLVLVDKTAAAQSQVWLGQIAVSSSSPDLYATRLANNALGSGKGRLNANLRTKHAYSYGAYSILLERRQEGALAAAGGIVADKTPEAVQEFVAELSGISKNGVSDTELSEARSAAIQGLPARFESNDVTAASFGAAQGLGFGPDYFATLPEKYVAVTKAQADQAARDHFAPERMPLVVVGPMESLAPRLEALKLGPIQWRDATGKLLSGPPKTKTAR